MSYKPEIGPGIAPTPEHAKDDAPGPNVSFNLSAGAKEALDELCRLHGGISQVEAIRRAIGTELLLTRERAAGSRVLIQKRRLLGWNKGREVYWP